MDRYLRVNSLQWLAFVAVVGGFIDVLLILAGASISTGVLLAPIVGVAVILASGELFLSLAGVRWLTAAIPGAFVVGVAVTAVAVMALAQLAGLVAQTGFLLWMVVVVALFAVYRPKWRARPATSWLDVGAAAGFAILAGYFCRDVAAFLPYAGSGASFPGWSDYYLHGTVIASFGDPLAIAQGDIFLAHAGRPFYHYAAFLLPAALLKSSGLPGLGLATAILLPLGLLVAMLGAYSMASELSARMVALVAVMAVACLPDTSHYWMRSAFFGFHWMLYTSPGSGYALGVSALSATCLLHGFRTGSRGSFALSLLLLVLLAMFRIHFVMLLSPAWAGTLLLGCWRARSQWKALFACLLGVLAFALAIALLVYNEAWRDLVQPQAYVDGMLKYGESYYSQLYHLLRDTASLPVTLAVGVALLMVAALGVLAVAFPVVVIVWARSGRWEAFDWMPLMLCGTFALLAVMMPVVANTDPSEFKQRHFVLLYAFVGLWTVARILALIGTYAKVGRLRQGPVWAIFMVAVLAAMTLGHEYRPGQASVVYMPWVQAFYGLNIEPGIAQAAAYIRKNSEPGDTLAMGGQAVKEDLQSPLVELISMADVPAYLSRTDLLEKKGPEMQRIVKERHAQIEGIIGADSWRSACEEMHRSGIRWYIEQSDDKPVWDPMKRLAVFRSARFAVYDAGAKQGAADGRCSAPTR
ncbi:MULTISPECIES: hypothetical protein [Cupriavidus]